MNEQIRTCCLYTGIFLFLFSYPVFSQYKISGNVKGDSLRQVNILLYTVPDHTIVTQTRTDSTGYFEIKGLGMHNYLLVVSSINYINDTLSIPLLSHNLSIGNIVLKPAVEILNSVVVTTSNIIDKNGVRYITPSAFMLKNTTDALAMLDKANLPRINIDVNTKEVQLNGGGTVKLLLNGRESNSQEISTLKPKEILRIEYHTMPEARYGNAAAVLDFITRQPVSGENIYLSLWHGPFTAFGEDNISVKVNHKNSQFLARYYLAYRNWSHLSRTNNETFRLSDENTLYRSEKGEPAKFTYDHHYINLGYNYQKKKQIFYIGLKTNIENQPHNDWKSILSSSQSTNTVLMTDSSQTKNTLSAVNVYFQQPLNDKDLLIFNVSGLHARNKYNRFYREANEKNIFTDLLSRVNEKQDAYQLSALFERKVNEHGTFDLGADYNHKYTEDHYNNTLNTIASLDTSNLRMGFMDIYSQYRFSVNKLNFNVGITLNDTRTNTAIGKYGYITIQPSLSLEYTPNKVLELDYYGSVSSTPPTLSQLSGVIQPIDSIQLQQGNPALKRQVNYYNTLNISLNAAKNRIGTTLYLNQSYVHAPIMEESNLSGNQVVRTIGNQVNFQKYNPELELRGKPFGDYVLLKFYTGIKYYISNGNNYRHIEHLEYYGGRIAFNYKKISLAWMIQENTFDEFWGETLTKQENGQMVSLSYNTGNYGISADVLNLFSKPYINAKENYSALAPYNRYEYLNEIRNLVRLNFKLNLSFGKQNKAAQRALEGDTDIESGILKGNK